MEITISPEELANGEMSETHLNQSVHAICEDGYVILSDVISHAHLDLLREKMDEGFTHIDDSVGPPGEFC